MGPLRPQRLPWPPPPLKGKTQVGPFPLGDCTGHPHIPASHMPTLPHCIPHSCITTLHPHSLHPSIPRRAGAPPFLSPAAAQRLQTHIVCTEPHRGGGGRINNSYFIQFRHVCQAPALPRGQLPPRCLLFCFLTLSPFFPRTIFIFTFSFPLCFPQCSSHAPPRCICLSLCPCRVCIPISLCVAGAEQPGCAMALLHPCQAHQGLGSPSLSLEGSSRSPAW